MCIKVKQILWVVLCLFGPAAEAVHLGQKSMGQVLIYPYYTVNNGLNTTYSIVNTTDQPKALKIRFLEGENSSEVLLFNVYLSAYDVWTGVLIPTLSTMEDHVGEPSALHVTNDETCAPYLIKNGQEFLPYTLDLNPANNSLERAKEGHIEVMEMGVLTGDAAAAVVHSYVGIPEDCDLLQSDWDDSEWSLGDLDNPSGGLFGSVSLVNVAEGLDFTYDAVALDNFWDNAGIHTEPSSVLPNLSAAHPQSKALLANGELAESEWSTGFEAVSAVLMLDKVYNEYAFDAVVNGKSEWVLNFPTKKFHVADEGSTLAPFEFTWDGEKSCDAFVMNVWDRAQQLDYIPHACVGSPCPPYDTRPRLCYSSNVIEFKSPFNHPAGYSNILGSNNALSFIIAPNTYATENGWAALEFNDASSMAPESGTAYQGLPVIGFMVQQFTNAAAQEGLLAQYGGLFMHKGLVVTDDESGD